VLVDSDESDQETKLVVLWWGEQASGAKIAAAFS